MKPTAYSVLKTFVLSIIVFLFTYTSLYSQSSYLIYAIGSNPSTIHRVGTNGSGDATIYTTASGTLIYSLAVDVSEGKIYFYTDNTGYSSGKIYRCNLDGSSAEEFLDVSSVGGVDGIAAGGGYLYYTPYTPKTLVKIKSDKSTTTTLHTGTYYINDIALDQSNGLLFFVEAGSPYKITRCDLSGGNKSAIYNNGSYYTGYLSAGNGYVFFSIGNSPFALYRLNNDGSGSPTAVFTPSGGTSQYTAYDAANGNLYYRYTQDIYKAGSDGTGGTSLINLGTGTSVYLAAAPNTSLPVELTDFSASVVNGTVRLDWETATEVNNYGFDIERKSVEGNWTKIGFVAGSGNSNIKHQYSYTDQPAGGTEFIYRLKQIDNDGTYEYSKDVSIRLDASENMPQLLQNNPNPFNPSTSIKFYLPQEEHVSITIYDELGREINTLLNERLSTGYHTVNWNGIDKLGNNAASGIYLYRLTAGEFSVTKKMILVK